MDSAAKKAPGAEKARFALKSVVDGTLIPIHHGFTVGRRSGDLVLESDPKVSSLHCEFLITEQGVFVHDLNSTNGVHINGVLLEKGKQKQVEECAEICIGRTHFILECLEATTVRPVRTKTVIQDSEAPVLESVPPTPPPPAAESALPTPLQPPPASASGPSPILSESSFIERMSVRVFEPEPDAARVAVKRPATSWQVSKAPMPKPAPAWSPSAPSSRQEAEGQFTCALFVALNLICFVWVLSRGLSATSPTAAELIRVGGSSGSRTLSGEWWRLLTATFVPAGVVQLASSMLALVFMGAGVAKSLGALRFSIVYLLAGLFGGGFSLMFDPPGFISVGAAGCVAGLLGALLVLQALEKAKLASMGRYGLLSTVNFLFHSLKGGAPGAGPAMVAGGLISGMVMAYFLEARGSEKDLNRELKVGGGGLLLMALLLLLVPRKEQPVPEVKAVSQSGAPAAASGKDARTPPQFSPEFNAGFSHVLGAVRELKGENASVSKGVASGTISREEALKFLRSRAPAKVAAMRKELEALQAVTVDERRMKELGIGLTVAWAEMFQSLDALIETGDLSHRDKVQSLLERAEKLQQELERHHGPASQPVSR